MKKSIKLSILALIIGSFGACINDDDGSSTPDPQPVQLGDIAANRFIISFTPNSGGGSTKVFEYYDPDGMGGNAPIKNEKWLLDVGFSGGVLNYDAEIQFYLDSLNVTDLIKARGTNYVVCYRDMNTANLRVTEDFNVDENGVKLATETTWRVTQEGVGDVRVTLNYIPTRKEGLCDAGVRIFEATINYENQ